MNEQPDEIVHALSEYTRSILVDFFERKLGTPSQDSFNLLEEAIEMIRKDERQKILKDNWMRYGGE